MQVAGRIYRIRTLPQTVFLSTSNGSGNDPPSKNSNDEKTKEPSESSDKKKEDAKQRMKGLLKSLNKQEEFTIKEGIKIYHPPPKPKLKKREFAKAENKEEPEIGIALKRAVKDVAHFVDGDPKENESELLTFLLSHSSPKQSLKDLLADMKFQKLPEPSQESALSSSKSFGRQRPRSRLGDYSTTRFSKDKAKERKQQDPIDLFGAPPLGIFTPEKQSGERKHSVLPTWDAALEREMKISVTQQPRNYFEEMILWTEQGKLWQFPIDNEVGLEEEKACSFAEHIFLEKHLKGWCPPKGPIKHFMELVCVGLSKNPYITAEKKRAHIEWYKNFFESKKDLLKEVGAI